MFEIGIQGTLIGLAAIPALLALFGVGLLLPWLARWVSYSRTSVSTQESLEKSA